jgi:prepilin-type N-terminal cleavage/methylation domain-containing protein
MCQVRNRAARRGMTLVELLLAVSILGIMAGALTGLALAVQQSSGYAQGYGTATQHARVTFERISRIVGEATATDQYPGAAVVSTTVSGYGYPDMLIVWHPNGPPANPVGPPLLSEVVIYAPDPSNPYQLLEVTLPGNSTPIPLNSASLNTPAWQNQLASLMASASSNRVPLTNLARAASVDNVNIRAAIRFETEMHPTDAEWAAYRSGTSAWNTLSWAQGICGSQTGLRQVAVRCELQLLPQQAAGMLDPTGQQAIPFLLSTAFCYQLHQ